MSKLMLVLVLLTAVLNFPVFAEETHSDGTQRKVRKITDTKLSDDAIDFIWKYFSLPKDYIQERLGESLPAAIEKARKGEEADIAKDAAFLAARLNKVQQKTLERVAAEEIKAETEKEQNERDDRKILLLKRLLWAVKMRLEKPSEAEDAQTFNEEVKPKIAEEEQFNEKAREQIKLAAEGQEDAKRWVRTNLSQKAVMSFAEGQRKSGATEFADQIVNAFSFSTGGWEHLDLHGKDGETQTVSWKKDEGPGKVMDQLFEKNGGFGGAKVAIAPHKTAAKKGWYMKDGVFTKGVPKGISEALEKEQAEIAAAEKAAESQQTESQGAESDGGVDMARGAQLYQDSCIACHRGNPNADDLTRLSNRSKALAVASGRMPKGTVLSEADKASLIAYLSQ